MNVSRSASALCLLLAGLISAAHVGPNRGTLVIAGGGKLGPEVMERFIAAAGGPDAPAVFIPTAEDGDPKPDPSATLLAKAGMKNITVLHTRDRAVANSEAFAAPLRKARAVWFSGGRQWRLVDAYLDTRTAKAIRGVLDRGGVVGGSSAGATIQGSYLVRGAHEGNTLMMAPGYERGLGLLRDAAIDQHLITRRRENDMIQVIAAHPNLLGIGIDEGTAIVVRGDGFEVVGASKVAIYDARHEPEPGGKVYYFLSQGDRFDLRRRTALTNLRPGLLASASKVAITPDLAAHGPVYMAGFGNNRVATGIHDELYARCVALSVHDKQLAVCEADLIGLFLDDTDRIRAAVKRKFPNAAVVIASTHVHEGPDTMGQWGSRQGVSGIDERYMSLVAERITQAAVTALESLRPASARLATVSSPELDGFIHDNRPPDKHDAALILMSLSDAAGKPIATVVNWANHPETLGSKNTSITADYPFYLCSELESRVGGTGILWNGAVGGMQSPLGAKVQDPDTGAEAPDSSFRKAEIIGRRVAAIATHALSGAAAVSIDDVMFRESRIKIPMTNPGFNAAAKAGIFKGRKEPQDGDTLTTVGLIRLSGAGKPVLEIALIPGELYPELSVGGVERYSGADFADAPVEPALKSMMTAPYRMLIGLANDEIGYIIPKAEWDEKPPYLNNSPKRYYGEVNSVGPVAAPRIAEAFRDLLRGVQQ